MTETFFITAAVAAIAALAAWFFTRSTFMGRLAMQEEMHKKEIESARKLAEQAETNYQKALKEMKETVVASMTAETERLLKQREEELANGNQTTMDNILKPLKESIESMRKTMASTSESHAERTAKLSEQLQQAVKEMQEKTADVGKKADSLSEALTGKPKVQGCFGENFLEDILAREGLEKGKHYSREAANEDQSRPDFVFHFKDGFDQKDLVVDSKVSLTAFVEYMNAENEEDRASALARHIKSVRKHIDELARKDYAKKVKKSFADYVIMFMPRDMAFRVALEAEPMLWQEAYQKNVLLATEQTIMPFLKIMQLTWNKYQHDTRIQEITKHAQTMIDRVADFYEDYKELGKRIKALGVAYNDGVNKIKSGGHSISTSARQVMSIGTRLSKGREFDEPAEIPDNVNIED